MSILIAKSKTDIYRDTFDIVVLILKIDHCLVFISIKLSYLILSYLILSYLILSYLILREKRSDIISESYYMSILIAKSKTDIYRDGNTVVISRMDSNLYPVKKFRKYLLLLNRNLAKCKDRPHTSV
jgi:hypothetical protein